MQNSFVYLNKSQRICSTPSVVRHQPYWENETIRIIDMIYSRLNCLTGCSLPTPDSTLVVIFYMKYELGVVTRDDLCPGGKCRDHPGSVGPGAAPEDPAAPRAAAAEEATSVRSKERTCPQRG